MKLTCKLVLVFFLLMSLVTLLVGWILTARERNFWRIEQERMAQTIADNHGDELVRAWLEGGEAGLQRTLKQLVPASLVQVQWRWFHDPGFEQQWGSETPTILTNVRLRRLITMMPSYEQGDGKMHTLVPIIVEQQMLGGLDISGSTEELERRVNSIWRISISAIGSMFALSILLMTIVGIRVVGHPLKQLIRKTERVAAGDFSQPLNLPRHDEFGDLAHALNQMCIQLEEQQQAIQRETSSRIEALNQLRHTDRLRTVGRLSAGVAHEMGTPLNVVLAHADLIANGELPGEEVAQSAQSIKQEVQRMSNIVRQLLDFARQQPASKSRQSLGALVESSIELLQPIADRAGVQLSYQWLAGEDLAEIDEEQLKQVLINLIMNAIQSMPGGGSVDVRLKRKQVEPHVTVQASAGEYFSIEVQDSGGGIEAEHLPRIFEPFFSTKDVGQGTGLGLSIAQGIVDEHGGWIDVESQAGEGSCFTVFLPVAD